VHTLQQSEARTKGTEMPALPAPLLQPAKTWGFEKHEEDDYIDFYTERGLPMMLSREGPKAASGDVNGDGLTDVYISGTAKKGGQLYLQTTTGFVKKEEPAFSNTGIEETAVLFFDCDNDKDLDLFTGAGGNNHPANSFQMQCRLYKNNGVGVFTPADALPPSGMNTSVAIANDIDNDGDLDLFVGSRSIPQAYGVSPASFIWINDGGGRFSNMDLSKSSVVDSGLVTGAVWADVSGDSKKELVIVGEWMPPRIFSFTNGVFTQLKTSLDSLHGWWQTVTASDMDDDGKEDLILGNTGENFYLQPSGTTPAKMWIADFDNNGAAEKIITRTINGKDVPVFLKRDVTEQIASLRKQNLKHEAYATKSVQDLFADVVLKNCIVKTFNYNSSVIAFSEGAGKFTVQKLPPYAQFSSVNAVLCTDVNGDGRKDVIAAGNTFEFQPQFSRLDASYGNVIINHGNRNFEALLPGASGLQVRGQVRDMVMLPAKQRNRMLFLQNNEAPVLYEVNKFPDQQSKDPIAKGSRPNE
jgi:hypothetical protein